VLIFYLPLTLSAQEQRNDLLKEAVIKFVKGDYAAALNLNIKALEKAQAENNCLLEAYATHQIGKMHYYLRDRHLALSWMMKANELARNCGVDSIERKTLHNIGSMYQELDQPDSSLYYYTKAKVLLDQTTIGQNCQRFME